MTGRRQSGGLALQWRPIDADDGRKFGPGGLSRGLNPIVRELFGFFYLPSRLVEATCHVLAIRFRNRHKL